MTDLLTNSSIAAFARCPRFYENGYIHLREPREPDANLSFGTAWHEGRAAYWNRQVHSYTVVPHAKIGTYEAGLLGVLEEGWRQSQLPLLSGGWSVVSVEREYTATIPGVSRPLKIKPDAIIGTNDGTYLWEHKTTSSDISPGSLYWERLLLDQQLSFYVLALREVGIHIQGVKYDVVRKPGFRLSKGESREELLERSISAIRKEPEKYFATELLHRSSDQLEAARADLAQWDALIPRSADGESVRLPRAPRACFDWGRRCEFFDVCAGEASLDDDRLFQIRNYV